MVDLIVRAYPRLPMPLGSLGLVFPVGLVLPASLRHDLVLPIQTNRNPSIGVDIRRRVCGSTEVVAV